MSHGTLFSILTARLTALFSAVIKIKIVNHVRNKEERPVKTLEELEATTLHVLKW